MTGLVVMGVDAGQTSTLAALCDAGGVLLGVGRGGPANHVQEPGGMARLESALGEAVLGAFAHAGMAPGPLAAACCGLTGRGQPYVARLWPATARAELLLAEHDTVTAHAGALAGGPGVVVIAGTGSVGLGVNAAGERAQVGGWSHIMGDEGSAYDLGRQALVAAARAWDGRGPATDLLGAVLAHFHKESLWDVHAVVYGGEMDRTTIAGLAPCVTAAAQQGDGVARGIVERGAMALAELAAAALQRLGMLGEQAGVAPVGGLWRAGEVILGPFARYLGQGAPLAVVRPAVYPPVLGAVLLALRAAGVPATEAVHRQLRATAEALREEK